MVEKPNKHKKVSFSEEDAATLIQRYDVTTVLKFLQEVENYGHLKIDWNELVKKTSTGISNAREYQMLWRYLAYRDALPEKFEDGAEPLDDDSDLEYELEALPPISNDIASEVAAYVKVLISSGMLSESSPSSSTIEAPLLINVPICPSSRTCEENLLPSYLMEGSSIIFPVTVQRQTVPSVSSAEGLDANRSASDNRANKRKRNVWSKEEDMQLQAAIQKHGEGNWASMLKEDNFPIKKSLAQLVQRWNTLKKGGSINPGANSMSPHYTAEQLATRHSLSLALDMPFKMLTATGMTDPVRTSLNMMAKNPMQPSNTAEASTIQSSSNQAQHLSQPALLDSCRSSAKSKVIPKKAVPKSNLAPDSAVRAPAVAAGISQSETASPLKAAQGRNGLKSKHISSNSDVTVTPSAACNCAVDTSSLMVENPTLPVSSNILSEQNDHVSSVANEVPVKQEVSPLEDSKVSYPTLVLNKEVRDDESCKK